MKVLHVAPHLDVGGADRVVLDLLEFKDPAVARDLVVTDPGARGWLPAAHEAGSRVWDLATLVTARHRPEFLLGLVAEHGYDVVHIMNSRIGYDLTPILSRLPAPPITVAHLHGEEVEGGGFPAYAAGLYRPSISVFCASSATLARRLRDLGAPDERIRVIHAGVDTTVYRPPDPTEPRGRVEPVILFPARLAPEKDPRLFLAVVAILRQRGLRFHARMLGGALEDEMRAEVMRSGLNGVVTIEGRAQDMPSVYRAADIAVLTSHTEGIPLGLLEAMSCGLPVVAPDVGSVSELVDDSVGALVRTRSAEALADAVAALLVDASLRNEAGTRGRERVESRFSVEGGARQFHALYAELGATTAGVSGR
jgi:glycosyltransferase involved in cell wall biosynthesis